MAKFEYTIEPSWTVDNYTGEAEIDDADLEGLREEERIQLITEVISDQVNNDCPWGWSEVGEDG